MVPAKTNYASLWRCILVGSLFYCNAYCISGRGNTRPVKTDAFTLQYFLSIRERSVVQAYHDCQHIQCTQMCSEVEVFLLRCSYESEENPHKVQVLHPYFGSIFKISPPPPTWSLNSTYMYCFSIFVQLPLPSASDRLSLFGPSPSILNKVAHNWLTCPCFFS